MKGILRKHMAIVLVFTLALTLFAGITTFGNESEKILLAEDFDTAYTQENLSVFGWNGWDYWKQYVEKEIDDSDYRVVSEPGQLQNKVASLYRPMGNADTTTNKFMSKNLSQPVDSGQLSIRFSIKAENEQAKYFQIRIYDEANTSKNLQFQVNFSKGTIADIKENGQLYYFGGDPIIKPLLKSWYHFEILLDMDKHEITYFEDNVTLGGPTPMDSVFSDGVISNIRLGTHREVPAGGLFYLDDIAVTLLEDNSQEGVSVDSPKFYKTDSKGKTEITKIGLMEGDISTEIKITNNSDSQIKLILAMGLYSGDILEDISLLKVSLLGWEVKDESVSLPVYGDVTGKNIRLFLWDEDFKPIQRLPTLEAWTGAVYYLSPQGNDSNNGSLSAPWKTLHKAASTVQAGSIVLLEDGDYYELYATRFIYSGEAGAPIIIRAKNTHGAKLVYPESTRLSAKMAITEIQGYITIEGLYFTQLSMANDLDDRKTSDIFLTCRGTDCNFINNRFEGAYEEAIKLSRGSERILIDGNRINNMTHEGIDSLNSLDVIIRNNHITEVGRVGIMVKGGARNNVVYNNYISNHEKSLRTAAITVGGVTNNTSPYDIREGTGFEAYNCVFYNNIIYSASPGLIRAGLSYIGAKDCHSYNNVVAGTRNAVSFREPNGITNGWEWDPPNVNPVLKNNIFINTTSTVYEFIKQPENLVAEHNLFYNVTAIPTESGAVYANPLFEKFGISWRLRAGSPAKGAGVSLPSVMEGFNGSTIQIRLVNFEGKMRTTPWDLGAY